MGMVKRVGADMVGRAVVQSVGCVGDSVCLWRFSVFLAKW